MPVSSGYSSKARHTNQNLEIREKNLEIFGGHLANFFCEVNLEIFLEIFVSRDLLFFLSFR